MSTDWASVFTDIVYLTEWKLEDAQELEVRTGKKKKGRAKEYHSL